MRFERALVRLLNRQPARPPAAGTCQLGSARAVIGGNTADGSFSWQPPQHTFVCGRTGSGKTTFLLRLMEAHLEQRVPFLFIDFHGPATEHILSMVGRGGGTSKVVLLEPWSDPVVGFNPLDAHGESPYPVVQELVSVFHHRLWPDAWGPRLEELLRMTLLSLAQAQLTLLEAPRFLSAPEFRRSVLSRVSLSEVRDFWTLRFERLSPSQKLLVTETVLNKLSVFQDPVLRYVIGQRTGSLDLDQALADGRTILVNLSAGQLWGSNLLLGALLVAKLKSAVYRRPAGAKPYSVILDEFQEMVAVDALDDYLRSFRKFGCSVYLATQHLQLAPEIRASIFGNCGRFCSFATSRHDATFLGAEFGEPEGKLIARALPDLATGTAVVKQRGRPPVLLDVEAPRTRPNAELARMGRSRCLACGQSRESIERDAWLRAGMARKPLAGSPQPVAASETPLSADSLLPEGYDDDAAEGF